MFKELYIYIVIFAICVFASIIFFINKKKKVKKNKNNKPPDDIYPLY